MTDLPQFEVIRPDWPAPANVRAFTTTRNSGFSQASWGSLNLGKSCGDDPQHVEQNRSLLLKLLPGKPRWLNQVHGTKAVRWDEAADPGNGADAVVSHHPGQVCAVLTADCLPALFCNQAGTSIAAVHAGWRGLAAGVLEATVLAMECKPADLMVWLGPAIGPRAFEVGKDVYNSFVNVNSENATAFRPCGERWFADLYQLARLALTRVGITQISGGQYCTYEERDNYFSYRRDGETGRMATVVWLEK